ncbi:hypothetical protein D3C75_1352480 [compost metagenome]
MHDARHGQCHQAGPQQRNVSVVVGPGRQHSNQFSVSVALDPGNCLGDLALFVLTQ